MSLVTNPNVVVVTLPSIAAVITVPDGDGFFLITGGERGHSGADGDAPTGTGFRHVTSSVEDPTVASDAVFKAAVLTALGITGWTKSGTTINITGSGGLDITLG